MILGALPGITDLGPENDQRLRRLRTVVAPGGGFRLFIVEAEPGPIRREVLRRIASWANREAIGALATVSLDVDAPLAAQLAVGSGVVVTGFEPPGPGEPPTRDWIVELNWSRDALPRAVPGPLILVVSQALHRVLFERAPDLYSWRRHTTHVAVVSPRIAVPLSSPGDSYWRAERDRLTWRLADARWYVALEQSMAMTDPPTRRLADALSFELPAPREILKELSNRIRLIEILLQLGDAGGTATHVATVRHLLSAVRRQRTSASRAFMLARHSFMLAWAHRALLVRDHVEAASLIDAAERGRTEHSDRKDSEPDELLLARGRLHAFTGAWEAATAELEQAQESPYAVGLARALAREVLCQVAFVRGDLPLARQRIADLVEAALPHLDTWGPAIAIRLAEVVVGVYPGEMGALLDAAPRDGEPESYRTRAIATRCLCARRAWLLDRPELARAELAAARQWVRAGDPAEIRALLASCEAGIALATGVGATADIADSLTRACELYRPGAPDHAATTGIALGQLWAERGRPDLAVAAYRRATEDARSAGDVGLAVDAEVGELGAAIEAGSDEDDTHDRLRALADELARVGRTQSEGTARTQLGRGLLRRGLRDAAEAELARARECFADTADAEGEAQVAELMKASG